MAEEKPNPFEDISDEDLIEECQERGIWNEESSIDDYGTDAAKRALNNERATAQSLQQAGNALDRFQ